MLPLESLVRIEVRGEIARVTDDYDDSDWLSHLRRLSQDWEDASRAAAAFLSGIASRRPTTNLRPAGLHSPRPAVPRPKQGAFSPPLTAMTPRLQFQALTS